MSIEERLVDVQGEKKVAAERVDQINEHLAETKSKILFFLCLKSLYA